MKKTVVLFFLLFAVSSSLSSQSTLTVEISGIRNNTGKIMLQVLDEKEKIITQKMSAITDKKCSFTFKDMKPGKYALRYYHDENGNMEMDTNFVGKPTEGYGFSNNVSAPFGPPSFEKWLFELIADKKIILKPQY